MPSPIPLVTAADLDRTMAGRSLVHQTADYWAERNPEGLAMINATRGTQLTWRQLRDASFAVARNLTRMGFRPGDFLAASLPMLSEHILLEYGCFRAGVIHAPLDLRLGPAEVIRAITAIGARGFAFLGKTPLADFRELAETVRARCPSVEFLIQFSTAEECIPGSAPLAKLIESSAETVALPEIDARAGVQVIFTSGSTGAPKPALLTHRSIVSQNVCLGTGFGFGPDQRVLLNFPASHVGGQSEILMTSLFSGGTAVMLEVFDPALSLQAIEKHRVTIIGQIPAMFQMEWRLSNYASTDLSSLRASVYGGQGVPRPFLEKMKTMAATIGTGLGLTEASGFCTYTPLTSDIDELDGTIGYAMPVYPFAIRAPIAPGGEAGPELSAGEVGHVCFQGPQNFAGYINNPQATAEALSTDGWLYTGDLGVMTERGLRLCGRAKWVIKTAGYQVYPGDVEAHFSALADKVASVGAVGQPHALWGEGIVAFVEPRAGVELSEAELKRHARGLAGYMRPLHYVLVAPGTMPLNRSVKVDVLKLQELAAAEVARLRERGRWDGGAPESD